MDLRPNDQVFGSSEDEVFTIQEYIGSGSFGVVYKIENTDGGVYALKTIGTASLNDDELQALINEGNLAVHIRHENVLDVLYFHDGREHENLPPYTIMEYADGGTLQDLIVAQREDQLFDVEALRAMFLQLARGMQAVNQKLVHRDIKPDNILIDGGVLKISDFGLSKISGAATRTQTFKGINHIRYCAPEAWDQQSNTMAMDMYSMGIVFYELATLKHPYTVEPGISPVVQWRKAHRFQDVEDPRDINPHLTLGMSQLIRKMLAKSPLDRYSDWDEVIAKLSSDEEASSISSDVSRLVERATERHHEAISEQLARKQENERREEQEELIAYSFGKVKSAAQSIVDEFNRQSEFAQLKLTEDSRFAFTIHKPGAGIHGVSVRIVPIHDAEHAVDGQRVKAWGYAKAPSGRGFNILIVESNKDDIYGTLRTIHVKHNPIASKRDSRPEPFPFEIEELPKEVGLFQAMHIYRSKRSSFDAGDFVPLLEELV